MGCTSFVCTLSRARARVCVCVCFISRYLKNAVKMMGRDKKGVAEAMEGYISMLEEDRENVRALLGMSLAFTLEGSPNKVCTNLGGRGGFPEIQRPAQKGERCMPPELQSRPFPP